MGQAFGWGASIVGGLEVGKKHQLQAVLQVLEEQSMPEHFDTGQKGHSAECSEAGGMFALFFLPFLVLDRLAAGWVQAKDGLHIGSLEKLVVRAVRKLSSLPLSSAVWLVQPVVASAS